jgi:hypothetical protein
MNHLTNLYKHKCEQLQEQINNMKRMLSEAQGTQDPTVIRFAKADAIGNYDVSPNTQADNIKPSEPGQPTFDHPIIIEVLQRILEEMQRNGATQAEIDIMMRYLRQLLTEYLAGGHGVPAPVPGESRGIDGVIEIIRDKLRQAYERARNKLEWHKKYKKAKNWNNDVNSAIDWFNRYGQTYIKPYGPLGWGIPGLPQYPVVPYVPFNQ